MSRQKIEMPSTRNKNRPNRMTITYIRNQDGHFVCPECNVVKQRQNSMHYHMKKHLEELNHVCRSCNKGFLQKQTLDLHIRSKHPELLTEEKQATSYACPFNGCSFSAMTKGNCIIHCLRLHFQDEIKEIMESNAEEKTITCKGCDVTFQSSSSFYYHCKSCIKKSEKYERLRTLLV